MSQHDDVPTWITNLFAVGLLFFLTGVMTATIVGLGYRLYYLSREPSVVLITAALLVCLCGAVMVFVSIQKIGKLKRSASFKPQG
jgi:hypothetical protein